MSLLPKFDVVVWIMKTDAFPALRDELIGLAADEPDESTEYEGMVDFHWGFDSVAEAESVAAAFTVLRERPELVLLRLSNCDDPKASFTFKDERHGHVGGICSDPPASAPPPLWIRIGE
jgi:hypothetical protein